MLSEDGKRLLSKETDDDKKWKPGWDKFRRKYSKSTLKKPWVFQNWEEIRKNTKVQTEFKDLCTTNGGKNVNNKEAPLYKQIRNYCSIEFNK